MYDFLGAIIKGVVDIVEPIAARWVGRIPNALSPFSLNGRLPTMVCGE